MKDSNKDLGYIAIYRSLLEWRWWGDPNTLEMFIYCLLKANYKDKDWHDIAVRRGSFVTSLSIIAGETGLSMQNVRTCLEHLESTNEITKLSTPNYTVITVINYDAYQFDQQSDQQTTNKRLTNDQQTTNKRLTTTNNINNINKENKDNNIIGEQGSPGQKSLNDEFERLFEELKKGDL